MPIEHGGSSVSLITKRRWRYLIKFLWNCHPSSELLQKFYFDHQWNLGCRWNENYCTLITGKQETINNGFRSYKVPRNLEFVSRPFPSTAEANNVTSNFWSVQNVLFIYFYNILWHFLMFPIKAFKASHGEQKVSIRATYSILWTIWKQPNQHLALQWIPVTVREPGNYPRWLPIINTSVNLKYEKHLHCWSREN